MKNGSKPLSVLVSVCLAVFLLTAAVAAPILFRGFYYAQIGSLDLVAETGYSEETIRGAFDQVMDYLVLGMPFGTGKLRHSTQGAAHFADCRTLFRLDFALVGLTAILLIVFAVLSRYGGLRLHRFHGLGPCFWAVAGMALVLLALLIWALIDFESLFTAFHMLFFPGKTNWLFDYRTDEIILILPEAFWARAAALVGALSFGTGAVLAVAETLLHRRESSKNVYEQLRQLRQ